MLGPGDSAFIPAGVVHASFNVGDDRRQDRRDPRPLRRRRSATSWSTWPARRRGRDCGRSRRGISRVVIAALDPAIHSVTVAKGPAQRNGSPDQSGHDGGSAATAVRRHWAREKHRWPARTTIRNCTTPCGRASSARGRPDAEPIIPLDTLLELTADARGSTAQKFDGVDLFIVAPHFDIDSDKDAVKKMADHIASYGLKVGSFVAPIWGGAGGGSAMGDGGRPQALRHAGAGRPPRIGQQMREHRHPPDRRHPHRFLGRRRGMGQGPEGQHQEDRRDLPRGRRRSRRTTASSSSPRARSAGAACSRGGRT